MAPLGLQLDFWDKPLALCCERIKGTKRAPSALSTSLRRNLGSTEELGTKNGTAPPQHPAPRSVPSPSAIHGSLGQGNPLAAKLRGGPAPHPPTPSQGLHIGHQPLEQPAPAFSWSFSRKGRVLPTPQEEILGANLTTFLWVSSSLIPTAPVGPRARPW